jgi:hypothetical protein
VLEWDAHTRQSRMAIVGTHACAVISVSYVSGELGVSRGSEALIRKDRLPAFVNEPVGETVVLIKVEDNVQRPAF